MCNAFPKTADGEAIRSRGFSRKIDIAEVHPESWRELYSDALPKASLDPENLVKELAKQKIKVKDQK